MRVVTTGVVKGCGVGYDEAVININGNDKNKRFAS